MYLFFFLVKFFPHSLFPPNLSWKSINVITFLIGGLLCFLKKLKTGYIKHRWEWKQRMETFAGESMPNKSKWLAEHTSFSWRVSNQSSQIEFWPKDQPPQQTCIVIPLLQKVQLPRKQKWHALLRLLGKRWEPPWRQFQPGDWNQWLQPDKDRQKYLLKIRYFDSTLRKHQYA